MMDVGIIHGKAYDLEAYAEHHPGGLVIKLGTGRDATEMFEMYHAMSDMDKVWKTMKVYEVPMPEGELPPRPKFEWNYEKNKTDPDFYTTLKTRVKAHFNGKSYKTTWQKSARRMMLFAIFLAILQPFWKGQYWTIPLMVMIRWLLGFMLSHDVCHCATSHSRVVNETLSLVSMTFGAFKSWNWMMWHDVGHHAHTNVLDYDIAHKGIGYFKQLVQGFPLMAYILSVGNMEVGSMWEVWLWTGFAQKVCKPVFLNKLGLKEFWPAMICEAIFRFNFFVMPCIYQGFWPGLGFAVLTHASVVGATALILLPQHPPTKPEPMTHDWALYQTSSSVDFSTHSLMANWISGGMNCHAIHHLMPTIEPDRYHDLMPIFKATLKEFGEEKRRHECKSFMDFQYTFMDFVRDPHIQKSRGNAL